MLLSALGENGSREYTMIFELKAILMFGSIKVVAIGKQTKFQPNGG